MSAVLITVMDGTVDYCMEGEVQVVLIDFSQHTPTRSFPSDVERDLALVRALPKMPWKTEIIRRLTAEKTLIDAAIKADPPPSESVHGFPQEEPSAPG